MNFANRMLVVGVAIAALAGTRAAQAQVNLTTVSSGGSLGDRQRLDQVGLMRGGVQRNYNYADLIKPVLSTINVPGATPTDLRTVLLYAGAFDAGVADAITDQYTNTGLFSPGSGDGNFAAAGAEYTKLTFTSPVVNGPGADLLIFSMGFQGIAGAQPYHISFDGVTDFPINQIEDTHLPSVASIPYYAFPGGVTSPADFLSKIPQTTGSLGNVVAIAQPVVQSLNLSNFGIPVGGSITTIYLQDPTIPVNNFIPTMVVGLPMVPEPSTWLLLAMGGAGLLVRRAVRLRSRS